MIINANALHIPLADQSVHCIVTSPPYWGLRDYGIGGQLGLERTREEYVANMVAVFRECWRVLRDDGTLWLNIGDSYASQPAGNITPSGFWQTAGKRNGKLKEYNTQEKSFDGLKPKDLVGIPWRLAFALQADGWYLRSDIIWSKPNPMPESVIDRPTKAHEYLFLLSKRERYYYDAEAIREEGNPESEARYKYNFTGDPDNSGKLSIQAPKGQREYNNHRNRRTVWTIPTAPYKGAHFATFPPALVEPCIKAGTSERGCCPKCGNGWRRMVERVSTGKRYATGKSAEKNNNGLVTAFSGYDDGSSAPQFVTTGWLPACNCDAGDPIPALVFDPFVGSGTTVKVAYDLGRRGVGLDLSLKYLDEQATTRIHNGHVGRLV